MEWQILSAMIWWLLPLKDDTWSHSAKCKFIMICLSVCRQEAVCGDVGETAVRHRCKKNVWAFWKYRGVHGTQRAWRSQQRCANHIQIQYCLHFLFGRYGLSTFPYPIFHYFSHPIFHRYLFLIFKIIYNNNLNGIVIVIIIIALLLAFLCKRWFEWNFCQCSITFP